MKLLSSKPGVLRQRMLVSRRETNCFRRRPMNEVSSTLRCNAWTRLVHTNVDQLDIEGDERGMPRETPNVQADSRERARAVIEATELDWQWTSP